VKASTQISKEGLGDQKMCVRVWIASPDRAMHEATRIKPKL
jgi:hypothetical protein